MKKKINIEHYSIEMKATELFYKIYKDYCESGITLKEFTTCYWEDFKDLYDNNIHKVIYNDKELKFDSFYLFDEHGEEITFYAFDETIEWCLHSGSKFYESMRFHESTEQLNLNSGEFKVFSKILEYKLPLKLTGKTEYHKEIFDY